MLSQKALKAFSLLRKTQSLGQPISTSCIDYNDFKNSGLFNKTVNQMIEQESDRDKPERKLKDWREQFKGKDPLIPINSDNMLFRIFRTKIELTPWGLKKHWNRALIRKRVDAQRFDPQRHAVFGPDISLAYLLLSMRGKVKFMHSNDQWILFSPKEEAFDLPDKFDPKYIVVAVDLSGCFLHYEGLENFQNCPKIKWANFARCLEVDDWCVDRIAGYLPYLEYLDLSDCPKVTERGLEALYRVGTLKTLIVTNNYKSAAFELTCMMLEDVVPGLQIEIREPKGKVEPQINEEGDPKKMIQL